jgi:osmotically-inducible protein OsmY
VVTLRGRVDGGRIRRLATRLARGVEGAIAVADELVVEEVTVPI